MFGYRPTVFYERRFRYRQKAPYNLALSYQMERQTSAYGSSNDPSFSAEANYYPQDFNQSTAEQQAYERFKESAYDSASWGVNLAERKQAMGMVVGRLNSLYQFSRRLRKLDFGGAVKALGVEPPNKGWRPRSRHYGGMWLEYHFGWEPLVKDIQSTMKILDSPIPYKRVSASGKASFDQSIVTQDINTDFFRRYATVTRRNTVQVKFGARVECVNPNLHLAESMGLINPLILAWELIPFSFVVDWFTGVGNYLQSFSDFAGLRMVDTWSVRVFRGVESETYSATDFFVNTDTGARTSESQSQYSTKTFLRMTRGSDTPSAQRPSFSWPDKISPVRAITASSLLLQQLKGR